MKMDVYCVEMSSVKYNEMTSFRPKFQIFLFQKFSCGEKQYCGRHRNTSQIVLTVKVLLHWSKANADLFLWSLLLHNVIIKLDWIFYLEATSLSSKYKRTLSFVCLVVALSTACFNWSLICCPQEEDEVEWKELKAEVFATVMDFFATGIPVISEEKAPSDTGKKILSV